MKSCHMFLLRRVLRSFAGCAVCALMGLGIAAVSTVNAATWSLASDFSITNGNPNGQWSYGTNSNLPDSGGVFAAYSVGDQKDGTDGFGLTDTVDFWTGGALDPNMSHNPHNFLVTCCGGGVHWEPGYVNFGTSGATYVDATWTAPYTGLFQIDAHFFNTQSASSQSVYVYKNATQLFSGTTGTSVYDNTQGAFFNSAFLSLNSGDVIHLLAGGGPNIAVAATIVPEPMSATLLAFGIVALVQFARRRR